MGKKEQHKVLNCKISYPCKEKKDYHCLNLKVEFYEKCLFLKKIEHSN